MTELVDAVVIGSGPNGLAASNVLADAGWDVVVLEAQSTPGGAVRTEELTDPGFRHDVFSSFYPLGAASPALLDLALEDHGLRWCRSEAVVVHVLDAERTVALLPGPQRTAESVAAFAPSRSRGVAAMVGMVGAGRRAPDRVAHAPVSAGRSRDATAACARTARGSRFRAPGRAAGPPPRTRGVRGRGGGAAAGRQRAACGLHARDARQFDLRVDACRPRPAGRLPGSRGRRGRADRRARDPAAPRRRRRALRTGGRAHRPVDPDGAHRRRDRGQGAARDPRRDVGAGALRATARSRRRPVTRSARHDALRVGPLDDQSRLGAGRADPVGRARGGAGRHRAHRRRPRSPDRVVGRDPARHDPAAPVPRHGAVRGDGSDADAGGQGDRLRLHPPAAGVMDAGAHRLARRLDAGRNRAARTGVRQARPCAPRPDPRRPRGTGREPGRRRAERRHRAAAPAADLPADPRQRARGDPDPRRLPRVGLRASRGRRPRSGGNECRARCAGGHTTAAPRGLHGGAGAQLAVAAIGPALTQTPEAAQRLRVA